MDLFCFNTVGLSAFLFGGQKISLDLCTEQRWDEFLLPHQLLALDVLLLTGQSTGRVLTGRVSFTV